ncbi:hypothetical protein ACFRAR_16680 [Kitasatospora sp. NPDC056651]
MDKNLDPADITIVRSIGTTPTAAEEIRTGIDDDDDNDHGGHDGWLGDAW